MVNINELNIKIILWNAETMLVYWTNLYLIALVSDYPEWFQRYQAIEM
jgi:hypothetical protein